MYCWRFLPASFSLSHPLSNSFSFWVLYHPNEDSLKSQPFPTIYSQYGMYNTVIVIITIKNFVYRGKSNEKTMIYGFFEVDYGECI